MPQTTDAPQAPAAPSGSVANPAPLPPDVDPWAIANDATLARDAKLERLHQLEQDVRQLEVAQEEGMTGKSRLPGLREVLAALEQVAGPEGGGEPQRSDSKS